MPLSLLRTPVLRSGAQLRRPVVSAFQTRFASGSQSSSSDSAYGTPVESPSNATETGANPTSSVNEDAGEIKSSRSTERHGGLEQTGLSKPASSMGDNTGGRDEEETSGVEDMHQDPSKPADEKAEQTLKQGNRKLDPAN